MLLGQKGWEHFELEFRKFHLPETKFQMGNEEFHLPPDKNQMGKQKFHLGKHKFQMGEEKFQIEFGKFQMGKQKFQMGFWFSQMGKGNSRRLSEIPDGVGAGWDRPIIRAPYRQGEGASPTTKRTNSARLEAPVFP